ncbi:MAG: hypothetical protein M1814_000083 [Vezdaea aestivalis]|nr:MAG: hypothetical protein M1814_000083 [Vezdaea aestivalis]
MAASKTPFAPSARKSVMKVISISLLLDLISFTFILPLFPKLLEFYRDLEAPHKNTNTNTVLNRTFSYLNAYKNSFSRPISDRYDIVLLGGALGSLFSFLQALASPIIGRLSDKYGRRTALMWSMAGNIISVGLWVAAVDFRTFLASRIVGGLSEGNVQLTTTIATDISDDQSRGSTMAIIGACFSVAFTFGPALGAWLSTMTSVAANPFATAAGFSFLLIIVETIYLYLYLPETLPQQHSNASTNGHKKGTKRTALVRTNSHLLLNFLHFSFILFFSGIEFSLPFMTYELFQYGSSQTGRLLGFMGLIASLLQGGVTRRLPPLRNIQLGLTSCAASLFLLRTVETQRQLYMSGALLAVTSATVVDGLRTLSSFEAADHERGIKLGNHRSWGQAGRSLGPLIFCTLYWWAGRQTAYAVGTVGVLGVATIAFGILKAPPRTVKARAQKAAAKI